MRKDVLFRGCTRPAMFMGLPYLPFAAGAGSCLLLTFYVDMFCMLLMPIVIFTMRQMARRDEMIFRLLALHWRLRARMRNVRAHAGMWVFSPHAHRRHASGDRS